MTGKTDKQFFFEVDLNWLAGKKGILTAKEAAGTLHVATPPKFGGEGKPWTPEHFFLSAISSCYMTTYLAFARKLDFTFADFECSIIGQIQIIEGKYKFTNINVYPRIYLDSEKLKDKAAVAVEKTHKYCLITNSINANVFYHPEIITGKRSVITGREEKISSGL